MTEVTGACLSQFHDDPNSFELLLSFADGREIGHMVSRRAAQRIAAEFANEFAQDCSPARQAHVAMTDQEIRQWIDACNHEPAKETLRHYLALRSPEPVTHVIGFDPFNPVCPHCTWLETNLGRQLDKKCELHQKIEDLQSDLQNHVQVNRSQSSILAQICEVIRAYEDDNPVEVARERMAEIEAIEQELEAAAPQSNVDRCPYCGAPVTHEPASGFIATCGQRVLTPRANGCPSPAPGKENQ